MFSGGVYLSGSKYYKLVIYSMYVFLGLQMEVVQVERSPEWFRTDSFPGPVIRPFLGPWLIVGTIPLPPWRNACIGTAVLPQGHAP